MDEASERTQDLVDVNSGIMSKVEYRMKWYNEDELTAQEAIDKIDSFSIQDTEINPFAEEEQAEV